LDIYIILAEDGMLLETITDSVINKGFESIFECIKKTIQEKKIKEHLEINQQKYKTKIFDSLTNDEAYDWQGLQDFIHNNISKITVNCFLLPKKDARQRMLKQTYRNAYANASAHTVMQQKRVNEYLQVILTIIGNALLDKIDNTLPYNIVVDEVHAMIETLKFEYNSNLQSYSNFIIEEISNEIKRIFDEAEYKGSFAQWIDGIFLPPALNALFHYRNPNIVLHGRKNEITILDRFLSDTAPLLFMAVTGSAGSGKSKLLYEYAKVIEDIAEWKVVFLTASNNTQNLKDYKNFKYPLNLLIIIDYAGDHAIELGEWIVMLRTCSNMPPKMRIVLIERGGMGAREGRYSHPLWYDRMISVRSSEDIKAVLFPVDKDKPFMELPRLEDDDLKNIMSDYAKLNNRQISSERKKMMLAYCSYIEKEGQRKSGVRPLIALFVVDAWLNNDDYRKWNLEQLLERLVNKYTKHWKSVLCANNSEIYKALERLLIFATATGGWYTLEKLPSSFDADLGILKGRFDLSELNDRFRELNEKFMWDGILSPLEPDLVGEYLVLQNLKNTYPAERNTIVSSFGLNFNYFAFLGRCIDDYAKADSFSELFENAMNLLLPKSLVDEHPITASILLFNLTYEQNEIEGAKTIEKLRSLAEYFEYDERVLIEYIKGLVNLSSEQDPAEGVKTIDKLRRFSEQYEHDEEIALNYAEGLVNLSSEQNGADGYVSIEKLYMLTKRYNNNEKILIEYAKGLFNLSTKQNVVERMETIEKLRLLTEQHVYNEKIALYYAQGLVNLSNSLDAKEGVKISEQLHMLLERFECNEDLYLVYARRLVNMSIEEKPLEGEKTIEKLRLLSRRFKHNESIIFEYAQGLFNLSNNKNISERMNEIEKLRQLAEQHEHNEEFVIIYIQGLYNLSIKQDMSEKVKTLEKICLLGERFGYNENIVIEHAKSLNTLSYNQDPVDAVITVGKLHQLMDRFENNKKIVFLYANGLYNLAYEQKLEEAIISVEKIRFLVEQFADDCEIALTYAKGLVCLIYEQNVLEGTKTLKKLRLLSEQHEDNEEIAYEYAQGLVNLSSEQSATDAMNSIEKLQLILEKYIQNEEIALKYAEGLVNLAEKQNAPEILSTIEKLRLLSEQYAHNEEITLTCAEIGSI